MDDKSDNDFEDATPPHSSSSPSRSLPLRQYPLTIASPLSSLGNSTSSSSRSTESRPHPLSLAPIDDSTSTSYYIGIPSNPQLLASTRPAQDLIIPPQIGHTTSKHIYPIQIDHSICPSWDNTIVPYITELIGAYYPDGQVCLDVVRIGYNMSNTDTIIWIGVPDNAISSEVAAQIVAMTKEFCLGIGITNFDVEIRIASVNQLGRLIDPTSLPVNLSKMTDAFCCTLGTPISTDVHPDALGTGGLLVKLPGHVNLFMVTAQHVVEPDPQVSLQPSGQHRKSVRIHTPTTFLKDRAEVAATITNLTATVAGIKDQIEIAEQRERNTTMLMRNLRSIEEYLNDMTDWMNRLDLEFGDENTRTFGRTYAYPKVSYNTDPKDADRISSYTEDWCLIETNIEHDTEIINVLNLMDIQEQVKARRFPDQLPSLTTLEMGCLKINGFLSESDFSTGSVAVLKKGALSSLTLGVTNGVHSYWRNNTAWSKELAVLNMDEEGPYSDPKPFSTGGDSGSTVIDRAGRICGILHAGCTRGDKLLREDGSSQRSPVDITYVTPWWWIVDRMRKFGLDPIVA